MFIFRKAEGVHAHLSEC